MRRAAALTTCHIALDVSPYPHIRPSLLILRKTVPDVISEAVVHSSITRFVGVIHPIHPDAWRNQWIVQGAEALPDADHYATSLVFG